MINSEYIKSMAFEYGADLAGIGDIDRYEGSHPRQDPRQICPTARCIIGFAFRIPKGIIESMQNGSQVYNYTLMGVKANAEEKTMIFLMRMARIIENEGYEACLQRTSPNIRIRDDHGTNPEVSVSYRLSKSVSVDGKRPEPEVLLDFDKAGAICGMGTLGWRGNLLTPQFGPMQRLAFIVTNAPLEPDPLLERPICDNCGLCSEACPGHTISYLVDGSRYDKWSCSVYYRGAHRSNPLMHDGILKDHPEREKILNGDKKFSPEEAKSIYSELDFLPPTQYGYVPCLCGKKCDTECYRHLIEAGRIKPMKNNYSRVKI
jgi:epoxyqueuosine reductase QueG